MRLVLRLLGILLIPGVVILYGIYAASMQTLQIPSLSGYFFFFGVPAVLIGIAIVLVGLYLHLLALEHFNGTQSLVNEPTMVMWAALAFIFTAVLWSVVIQGTWGFFG